MVERAYGNIDDNRAYVRELFLRAVNQVSLLKFNYPVR